MPNWKKVIVSGSDAVLSSVAASSQITIGAVTASTENGLVIGPPPAGGAGEGGQLVLQSGPGYSSGSHLDNWQNTFRLLRGTNAITDAVVAQWNLHTKQMSIPAYNNVSAFAGTAVANLAVDSGGNIITVSTTGGSVFPYVGNAVITGSLTTTGIIYAQPNGGMYFQGGDDAALYDINVANTMGVYGVQDSTVGAIKLGSNGAVLYGSGSRIGLGTTTPTSASFTVNGNVWANSFTGSLFGTSSWARSATTASTVISAGQFGGGAQYLLVSATQPGNNAVSPFLSTLVYDSTTNTLPTTASWATSASYALTASYVNPLRQDVIITGSLITSGSTGNGINTANTTLTAGPYTTVDWGTGLLKDQNSINTVDWLNGYTLTAPSYGGVATVQWGSGILRSLNTSQSIDWDNRIAYDSAQTRSIDWNDRMARDLSDFRALDYQNRLLYDSTETISIPWNDRTLNDSSGNPTLGWNAPNELYSIYSLYYYKSVVGLSTQDDFINTAPNIAEVNYTGEIIEASLDSSVATNDLVYLDTDLKWYKITQGTDQCSKLIGVCVSAAKFFVLLEGTLTVTSNVSNTDSPFVQSMAAGRPIYIRDGSGSLMSTVAPSTSGNYVRVLGHAYQQSAGNPDYWVMKFRPSMDWYTIG